MEWLTDNWFFILLLFAFAAMHLFGHGHGGHRGHPGRDMAEGDSRHAGHQDHRGHAHDTPRPR